MNGLTIDWASGEADIDTAYAAASYTPAGAQKAALGTLQIEADTAVSVEERLVDFSKYRIIEANLRELIESPDPRQSWC